MFQRFVEAVEPRLDQGALVGEPGGQLFGAFGEAAPCAELKMPVERHDIGQEPVEPVPVLNQTLTKMSRVPVEQVVSDAEDDGFDARHGTQPAIRPAGTSNAGSYCCSHRVCRGGERTQNTK